MPSEENLSQCHFVQQIPHLLSNPELCNEKPATNRLNHDPLLCLEQYTFLEICIHRFICVTIFSLAQIIDDFSNTNSISQTSSKVSAQIAAHISSELPSNHIYEYLQT
jgi:hypothetical protein